METGNDERHEACSTVYVYVCTVPRLSWKIPKRADLPEPAKLGHLWLLSHQRFVVSVFFLACYLSLFPYLQTGGRILSVLLARPEDSFRKKTKDSTAICLSVCRSLTLNVLAGPHALSACFALYVRSEQTAKSENANLIGPIPVNLVSWSWHQ